MFDVASLIVYNLLIALIIGFVIGYIIAKETHFNFNFFDKNKNLDSETKRKLVINPVFKKNSNVDYKPHVLSSPKNREKDDLTKIKGIDFKMENDLNNLGVYHFEQIANWSNKNCDWIEEFLLLPGYTKNNQWVIQAKALYAQKFEVQETIA